MLRPVVNDAWQLRRAQQDALLSAFGLGDGPRPELFLMAQAALSLLAAAGSDQPFAVVADDVQWLDAQSQEASNCAAWTSLRRTRFR
jgi:hypothetical protein